MMTKNGFIGLGHMGSHMAINLYKNTGSCLAWNRSKEKLDAVCKCGPTAAESVAQMARDCDIIIMCLADPTAVRSVMLGSDGILENAHKGLYIADTSTIDMETTAEMVKLSEAKGIHYIDIPVSGGVYLAEAGRLSLMCGCTKEEAAPIQHALDAISRISTYLGKRGNGTAAKLIHNAVSLSTQLIDAEAVVMADFLGIPTEAIFDVIQNGAAHNDILTYHGPRVLTNNFEGGHDVVLAVKDLDLCSKMCKEMGCPNFTLNQAIQWYRIAMNKGYAHKDTSSLFPVVREVLEPKELRKSPKNV